MHSLELTPTVHLTPVDETSPPNKQDFINARRIIRMLFDEDDKPRHSVHAHVESLIRACEQDLEDRAEGAFEIGSTLSSVSTPVGLQSVRQSNFDFASPQILREEHSALRIRVQPIQVKRRTDRFVVWSEFEHFQAHVHTLRYDHLYWYLRFGALSGVRYIVATAVRPKIADSMSCRKHYSLCVL